jgi:hypothetical protein
MADMLGPIATALFGLFLLVFGIFAVKDDNWGAAVLAFVMAVAAFGAAIPSTQL